MKLISKTLTMLGLTVNCFAETVIVPLGTNGSVVLQESESAIFVGGIPYFKHIVKDGITNILSEPNYQISVSSTEPLVISGPIEMVFDPCIFTYRKITNSPFRTIVHRYGQTNSIVVDTNETVKFFASLPATSVNGLIISIGSIVATFDVTYGMEFDGDLQFVFTNLESPPNCDQTLPPNCYPKTNSFGIEYVDLINYYIVDEFIATPSNGYVSASPGDLILAVEKSTNLEDWSTSFIHITGHDQYAFYRLKLSRPLNEVVESGGSFMLNNNNTVYYQLEEPERPPYPWE